MEKRKTGMAPGRHRRKGISIPKLAQMFPNEEAAREWLEAIVWPDGPTCPRCSGNDTHESTHKTMPYRCRPCKRFFSVRTGTVLEASNLPLTKWVWAIYLEITNLKGVSSMKLHRDIGVTQTTAWFMLQRIREGFVNEIYTVFAGPVEVDETYVGGLEKNKHSNKRLRAGRGTVGKVAAVGVKDRNTGRVQARVIDQVDVLNLSAFISRHVKSGQTVYTDDNVAYGPIGGRYRHQTVNHSARQYVCGTAHGNGLHHHVVSRATLVLPHLHTITAMKREKRIERDNALEAADRLTCGREQLVLSDQDWEIFSAALVNPPEPNAALRKAFASHDRLIVKTTGG